MSHDRRWAGVSKKMEILHSHDETMRDFLRACCLLFPYPLFPNYTVQSFFSPLSNP